MEYFADIKYSMLLNQRILAKGYPGGEGYPGNGQEHGRISLQGCDARVV